MIVDSIDNAALYAPLGPRIAAGLRYLAAFDPATEDGRYPLGDGLVASVSSYETAPAMEKRFEAHRRNLDIQYVVSGSERLLHAPTPGLEVETPYREEEDVAFLRDPAASSSVLLRAGDFAILFPGDAHKPGCMAGGREAVRKVVVKVEL